MSERLRCDAEAAELVAPAPPSIPAALTFRLKFHPQFGVLHFLTARYAFALHIGHAFIEAPRLP
jgi:hypothetical protein